MVPKVLKREKVLYKMDLLVEVFVLSVLTPLDIDDESGVLEWIKVKVNNDDVTKIKITIQTPKPSEMSTNKS